MSIRNITPIQRFRGCLLGSAIGDALGMPAEGMIRGARIDRFYSHPKGKLRAGQVTDDTILTQATVDSLIRRRSLDPADIALNLGRAFKKNKDLGRGFGQATITALTRILKRRPWNMVGDNNSLGNGAAMRIAPIALFSYANLEQLKRNVELVAMITHKQPEAINGSLSVAYITAKIINSTFEQNIILRETAGYIGDDSEMANKLRQVGDLLTQDLSPSVALSQIGTSGIVFESVGSSIYLFLRFIDSFENVLVEAASCGGDTDTIASMVGAMSGAYHGEAAIPKHWGKEVEGAREILRKADKLYSLSHGT